MRNDSLSLQKLVIVLVALVALATTSLALSYVELPPWIGLGSALLIAAAKVVLVALYFMELAEHRGGLRLAAIAGPVYVLVLVLFVLLDAWSRRFA